jgi:excisionase family DNA binding protein
MDELLTAEQVAEHLQMHVGTVRAMCLDGTLPAINISPGRRASWRVARADLEAWLLARRAKMEATR